MHRGDIWQERYSQASSEAPTAVDRPNPYLSGEETKVIHNHDPRAFLDDTEPMELTSATEPDGGVTHAI